MSALADDKYIQTSDSINKNGLMVENSTNNGNPYLTTLQPVVDNIFGRGHLSNTCGNMGYNTAYSPYTSKGVY